MNEHLRKALEWCRSEEKRVKQEAEDARAIPALTMPLGATEKPAGEFK